jgi:hypothetical protein
MSTYTSIQYLLDDYPKTLFPLSTTSVVAGNAGTEVLKYIYEKVLNRNEPAHSFLSQARCHASKQGFHLRRTVKLDQVAELFIYDIVYRNRALFRKDFSQNRRSFGYKFEQGKPISPSKSYGEFKRHLAYAKAHYKFALKLDIATYFNSIYHHYIVRWFSDIGAASDDVEYLGQFLREANTGVSIDCLPHGIHATKVIGAEFLKFIDNSVKIKCDLLLRFMDDFYLFSNEESVLIDDFLSIQRLLGEKGLSLNSAKTILGQVGELGVSKKVDELKASLLKIRRTVLEPYGGITFEDEEYYEKLTPEQVEYLLNLLKEPDIDESDAELVLALLRDHGTDILARMNVFLERFPSLSKSIYYFSKYVEDQEALADLILIFIKTGKNITEDQLFWMAKISEDYLSKTSRYPNILIELYEHPKATLISRAKILEIPEQRFGMIELREEHLRTGKSDWLAWASAVGTRGATAISRNHTLTYFSKASPMNKIIGDCIQGLS